MNDKCSTCVNYLQGIDRCKYCNYEYGKTIPLESDQEWDILKLDDEIEWSFLQIQYYLKSKGIDCLQVINWFDDNIVILIGAKAYPEKIARVLKVHKEVISSDGEIGIMVINLYHEKHLRGLI